MTRKLVVLPSAASDMKDSASRYESERRGLGRFFLQIVRASFLRVRETPMQFPVVAPDLRRALVPKFPYGIFFRVLETKIVVIAVLHLHRHPETWHSRE
jgi:plasmid stabilization system protein ParE